MLLIATWNITANGLIEKLRLQEGLFTVFFFLELLLDESCEMV